MVGVYIYIYIYTHTHTCTHICTHISTHTHRTHIYTYATPWSGVHLQKLTVPQLFTKFPAFYGTRRFITVFTSDRIHMYTHTRVHIYLAYMIMQHFNDY
jgi:hypothetical protein